MTHVHAHVYEILMVETVRSETHDLHITIILGVFLWNDPNWGQNTQYPIVTNQSIKGTNEKLFRVDSSVPLMHHEPSDLGKPTSLTYILVISLTQYMYT